MMRLYLLPLSTRRTLLYAQRLQAPPGAAAAAAGKPSLSDRVTGIAARKWAEWEARESGWQRKVTDYGNQALRRIPYEEWGLRSVPPLSSRRQQDEAAGREQVQLVFPGNVIPAARAGPLALTLATEREALHRKRLMWCVLGMPLTAPVALLPVIPNLPFFYLVYRAWSHWRAIQGGKHIQWLARNHLLIDAPSKQLDALYPEDPAPYDADAAPETESMLLTQDDVPAVSKSLDMPVLSVELERAIWQVETALDERHSKGSEKKQDEKKADDKEKQS